MGRRFITPDEAISLLKEGEEIHTYRDAPGVLFGADHDRERLIEKIKANPNKLEIGGGAVSRNEPRTSVER